MKHNACTLSHPLATSALFAAALALALCVAGIAFPARAHAVLSTAASASDLAAGDVAVGTGSAEVADASDDPSVSYEVKLKGGNWQDIAYDNEIAGTTDESAQIAGLMVEIDPGETRTGSIYYRVHLSTGKWSSWKKNGGELTSNSTIDGVQVKLKGTIATDYDIVYCAHVQGIGWQRRMRNAETAGAPGSGKHLEALRINLEPKSNASGWVDDGGTWRFYQQGTPLANRWIVTNEHPIETTGVGLQRYWVDASGALARNRYIVPSRESDSKAKFTAYATDAGYVARGKFTNSDGLLLARPTTGRLYIKTRWLTTRLYDDGKSKRYRLVKKGPAAVVKTGLFKVNGKKYYGWEDGRGFVMRSKLWYVADNWYKAGKKGVLKNFSSKKTKVIERYVKWAIAIANDDSHGYSQANRWGPDYDCSSLVCSALKAVGFPESGATYTGNMKECLQKIGFVWHDGTSGLRRGDIMLVHGTYRQHTEIYLGNNQLVGAHIAETGGVNGKEGDQTGNEISVTKYYNAPWQGYLRYRG